MPVLLKTMTTGLRESNRAHLRTPAMLVIVLLASWSPLVFSEGRDFEAASAAYRAKNYSQAFADFTSLAKAGDARAQTVLAIMYKYGESVPINLEQAYDWYLKAAVQGYPPAQYNVGVMLGEGKGVDKDTNEALRWLRKAADAGYERAKDQMAQITGDQSLANNAGEPVAWSKSWNLRLPNDIRYDPEQADLEAGEFRVQLGAFGTVAAAERLWKKLRANQGDLFQGLQAVYSEAPRGQKSIYRLQVGIFNGRTQATYFCDLFKRQFRSNGCLVVAAE